MPRVLENWIDSFMEYSAPIMSPEIYKRWTAYSTLTSALERRVWTEMSNKRCFPNMLIIFVAEPGVGKSNAIEISREMIRGAGDFNLGPNAMTKAAMVDQLGSAQKNMIHGGVQLFYNALICVCTEFGTLLPEYDVKFLNTINELYDCMPEYRDRTRGGQVQLLIINRPHISILSGTQPQYLSSILPEVAYGMGFTSRLIMIHASEKPDIDLWQDDDSKKLNEDLKKTLISDLKDIAKVCGPFGWTQDAKDYLQNWCENQALDAPTHARLIHYLKRRHVHVAKLSMGLSIAESNDLVVELRHVKEAREQLIAVEKIMPEIFKEMSVSQDGMEINEIHSFIFDYTKRMKKKFIPEPKLIRYISQRVPANRIGYLLDTIVNSGLVEVKGLNIKGKREFHPITFDMWIDKEEKK